jgi:hypothetical protein
MPTLKDPDRVPDPSTLRRWSVGLDRSELSASFRRRTLTRVAPWLRRGNSVDSQPRPLGALTRLLQILWPLRR